MSDTLELLQAMEDLADELVQNATELREASAVASTLDELDVHQKAQEKLVARLVKLDTKLGKADLTASRDIAETWERISKKLTEFEKLNEKFIENMSVRQGILKFELHELRESRKSIGKVKGAYARRRPPGNDGKGPRRRVDTLS